MAKEYAVDKTDTLRMLEENFAVEMTVTEARAWSDHIEDDALMSAVDGAQGDVFTGQAKQAYVVIKIVPG